MQNLPLSDLFVLDLSQYVSGPYCTKILADFGAMVIKIENPGNRDVSRQIGPFPDDTPDLERSGLYLYLNTGKKSVTLDIENRTGNAIFSELVEKADVMVENSGPDVFNYHTLTESNPTLIMASISYFGADGPYRDFNGADVVLQALGGIMNLTGASDREPLKIAGPQAEYHAGINAATAIMTALCLRDETNAGQHLDISIMECMASILEGDLLSNCYDGTLRTRDGSRHPTVYPSTILPCKDGYVHVDASTDWELFATFTGISELLQFKPGEIREKADDIDELLKPWLAQYTSDEIFHLAQEWRLPFARVMEIDQLQDDVQLQSRDYFNSIEHPQAGNIVYPGLAFKSSEYDARSQRAPLLGEHNEEIFCGLLGYSRKELVQLIGMGII